MKETELIERLRTAAEEFVSLAHDEMRNYLDRWPRDFAKNEVHDVVGALIARQVTLAVELAVSPSVWNGHIAPLILRSMADVYINLVWVLKSPEENARKFIIYGLGQEKLQLERRRQELDRREPNYSEKEFIEMSEAWIERQRAIFLTEVNLGSWSGFSSRRMAEEADCLDFYNYVYSPFSACVHSMWHHVGKYNVVPCENPLHRYHHVPVSETHPLDADYLYLAGKYLDKTFSSFSISTGIEPEPASAFEVLSRRLAEIAADTKANGTT